MIAVAADAELAGILGGLHHAESGGAGGVKHHVGAAAELALGEFGAFGRITPGGGGRAGHVLEHLGLRIYVMHALGVAEGELADERNVHAADETDLAGAGGERGRHAAEEGGLLL